MRLRFALFADKRWRREERALKTLPPAVILKRFATDLRVLLRAMGFGIRGENNSRRRNDKRFVRWPSALDARIRSLAR